MKKIILLSVILFFAGLNMSMAQVVRVNPIPSYNYYMMQQSAAFQESGSGETREKRDMNVVITSSSDATEEIAATVFIISKDGTQILGPYTVFCNEPLSVNLTKGKWGVSLTCNFDVTVSVWTSKEKSLH